MNQLRAVSPAGLVVAAVLYLALNTLFDVSIPAARIDLTEDKLFTLSKGTHVTIEKIDEPIEVHYFFSEQLGRTQPAYAAYARRVSELLGEIATASHGKIIVHEHNPEAFSRGADLAVSLGIQGVPVNQEGALAYFGLAAVNSVDEVELIPFFQPERENLLEYDLVQIIHALSDPQPTVVGVMSSLPILGDMQARMQGRGSPPWAIAQQLRASFELLSLPQSLDDVPTGVKVMMIVHPRALNERTMYALEQFLFRGGHAMMFIDPKSESDVTVGPNELSTSAGSLARLFEQWGIEVPQGLLVGDRSLASKVNAGTAQQVIAADYVVWQTIRSDNMTQEDPVTSQLPVIRIASPGYIVRRADSPLLVQPLLFSTKDSAAVKVEDVRGITPDILGLLKSFKADDQSYVMAARLTGEAQSAFPLGPPPRVIERSAAEQAATPGAEQIMRAKGPINVILVTDSDLLDDSFWQRTQTVYGREVKQAIASNADFVVNAISNLAGGDQLIGLRSRGVSQRPFERVVRLQREAELRLRDKERALQDKLKQAQLKVAQLKGVQTRTDANTGALAVDVSLTSEQSNEMERLRGEIIASRQQLRGVQRGLREDVDSLQIWLQFLNIGLVPLLVAFIAVVLAAWGALRRRRAQRTPRGAT